LQNQTQVFSIGKKKEKKAARRM